MGAIFLIAGTVLAIAAQTSGNAGAQASPPPVEAAPENEETIVVTGAEEEEEDIATGSRVRKAEPLVDYRGFVSQIASSTGVGGLTPGSGMDPFAGPTRNRIVKICRSSDKRMSSGAICELAKVQRALAENDLIGARARLDRILYSPESNQADLFFAHRFTYEMSLRRGDAHSQSEALSGMIATGLLSDRDRVLALKTLASLAIGMGDDQAAIRVLEQIVREAPSEAKAQANLGVLYAQSGSHDRARPRIAEAVRLTKEAGIAVPEEWAAYLRN